MPSTSGDESDCSDDASDDGSQNNHNVSLAFFGDPTAHSPTFRPMEAWQGVSVALTAAGCSDTSVREGT